MGELNSNPVTGQNMLQTSVNDRHHRAGNLYLRCEDREVNGRAMSSWRSDDYVICT